MSDSPAHPSSTRAWLELTRAPNFLTAWGDPMAGALLASTGNFQSFDRLIPGVIGVLCLYAAGMILVTTLCSIVTLPLVCLGLG